MSDISAPSGAGRSPYNSEPSIEAPNSNTPTRHLNAKPQPTQAIRSNDHTAMLSTTGGKPTASRPSHTGRPELTWHPWPAPACRGGAGVLAFGCGHLPKSPGEIRLNSGLGQTFCPVSQVFQRTGGTEQHVT